MKTTALLILLALSALAGAVSFDADGFGLSLSGWRKNRSAVYSLADGNYRTRMPSITATPGGGIFLSTQVDYLTGGGATCHLQLTFGPSGTLEGAQIKGLVAGRNLDTGLVRRAQPQPAPAPVEGDASAPPPPAPLRGHPTDELIAELFTSFDNEFRRVAEAKEKQKRDLFSRLSRSSPRSADIAAGLRHNLNLILQHVHR